MKKIFIRRKKLIEFLEQEQRRIRKDNQKIKENSIKKKDDRGARDWQFYEDGNDNAFNYIIGSIKGDKI